MELSSRRVRWGSVAALIVSAALVMGTVPARADTVQNDVVVGGNDTVAVGGSTTVNYRVLVQGAGLDGEGGCNATAGSPATVSVNVPLHVIVTPASRTFSSCNAPQSVVFSADQTGDYVITVSVSDAGAGTYDASAATFTLRVVAADSTPPVITKIVTGTAGANGWYTSNVSVAWTVTDPDSAIVIDSGCGTQNFTSEVAAATSSCSVHSLGGSANDSVPIKIDKTAPTASLSPSGTAGLNGWYTSSVSVTTSGTDSLSNPVTCTGVQSLSSETTGTVVNGSCTNAAGLSTAATPLTVKIDTTGPSAALQVTEGTPGTNGWYTSNVTVATTGNDAVSGGVTCSGDAPVNGETLGTVVTGSCTNAAGLITAATPLTIKLDKSSPTATLLIDGTLGANNWYTSDVNATTTGGDNVSNPVVCSGAQLFTANVASLVVNGLCTNDAGLTQGAAPATIKIDKTAPSNVVLTITGGAAGEHGWYTSDVTVHTSGAEDMSGLNCTVDQHVTGETTGTVVNGSCTNDAGLTTNAAPITVKIDQSGPAASLTPTGTLGANGWYVSDVSVATTGSDAVSGPVTCTANQPFTDETAGTTVNGSCTNDAGLTTAAAALTLKIDRTAPTNVVLTVTGGTQGANGWYTTDITVATTGEDGTSGVTCTLDQQVTGETPGTVVTGSCTNGSGLTTHADPLTIKIDQIGPTAITFDGPIANGSSFVFGSVSATDTCSATDSPSGFDNCEVTGYATTVGSHTLTATAKDNAGNTSTATLSYTVLAWTLRGFYQPTDMSGVVNIVKNGSTVPLKFEVFAGATELTATSAVQSLAATRNSCLSGAVEDLIEITATGATALRYDTTGGQFIYNWKTPSTASACYRVTVTTADGSTIQANFKMK